MRGMKDALGLPNPSPRRAGLAAAIALCLVAAVATLLFRTDGPLHPLAREEGSLRAPMSDEELVTGVTEAGPPAPVPLSSPDDPGSRGDGDDTPAPSAPPPDKDPLTEPPGEPPPPDDRLPDLFGLLPDLPPPPPHLPAQAKAAAAPPRGNRR
jgi:hypothetical protein